HQHSLLHNQDPPTKYLSSHHHHPDLPSFPTRRSSDLPPRRQRPRLEPLVERLAAGRVGALVLPAREHLPVSADLVRPDAGHRPPSAAMRATRVRSDMETSSPCPGPGALRRRRGHLRFAAPPYPPRLSGVAGLSLRQSRPGVP